MAELTYAHTGWPATIRFSDGVLATIAANRQLKWFHREAGGQLFGRFSENVLEVVHASEPADQDRRSRFSFVPNRRLEQKVIHEMFAAGLHYVGDWHTHPEDVPNPSPQDGRSIQDCFRDSKHQLQYFILVVAGRESFPLGLSVSAATTDSFIRLEAKQPTLEQGHVPIP